MQHGRAASRPALRRLTAIAAAMLSALLAGSAAAQIPTLRGTPISVPSDCRTGACAQSQSVMPATPPWTAQRAAAAMAGYWAANDHVSYLVFADGDAVARVIEVVNGQVTRDRHVTFTPQAPDLINPGHLVFNIALQTTGVADATPERMTIEFYNGMHELDLNVTPERRVRLWFVRKTDQLDVDALEHPRPAGVSQAAESAPPEPGQRLSTAGVCPEARAWQASLSYPARALRQGVASGSVTLSFVARPDGSTGEYRVDGFTDERLVGASLEALARLHCSGVATGQLLRQTIDYRAE